MVIDPSLFAVPATPQELADFRTKFYPEYKPAKTSTIIMMILLVVVGVFAFLGAPVNEFAAVVRLMGMVMVVAPIVVLSSIITTRYTFQKRIKGSVKAYRFAQANGLQYEAQVKNPTRSGFVFSNPNANRKSIFDVISRTDTNPFEIGNFYYETGSGKSKAIYLTGYMRITLDRNLPNMVLDAKADDTRIFGIRQSNLGVTFSKDQALRLEGNFNDYFTLYAPKEYETDALYVFTPDFMARLIDEASLFNAEIIDNNLYIYSINQMPLDKPETYERLFSILDSVGAKAITQTDNYRDSRSEVAGAVDINGRRLKKSLSVTATIALTAIVILYTLQQIPMLIGIFTK